MPIVQGGLAFASSYGIPLLRGGARIAKRLVVGGARGRKAASAAAATRTTVTHVVPKVNLAVDSVMIPLLVTDFFTEEPLMDSEVGQTVTDLYTIYSFARLGGAGVSAARSSASSARYLKGKASKFAESSKVWVKHFPRPQKVMESLRAADKTQLHRTWNKTFDAATKTWYVTAKNGTEILRFSKEGVKRNKNYLGKMSLAGGSATGLAILFGEDEEGSDVEFSPEDIEVIDNYFDALIAASLQGEPEEGDEQSELYRFLTFPRSLFNEIANDLDLPPSSAIVAEAVGETILSAMENPSDNEISLVDSEDTSGDESDDSDGDDDTDVSGDGSPLSSSDFKWG